jgi:hypothetical protein
MLVKNLIKKLQTLNPDAEVIIPHNSLFPEKDEILEESAIEITTIDGKEYVLIY